MDFIDLILLLTAGITCVYTSVVIFRIGRGSPIPTLYLLFGIAILSLGVNFLITIPVILFDESSHLFLSLKHNELIYLIRFGNACSILFILSFTLVTYLPSLKIDLKSLSLLIVSTFFTTSAFIIDMFTMDYVIESNKLKIEFNPLGFSSLLISLIILVSVLISRYQEIGKLMRSAETKIFPFKNQYRSRNIFYFLIVAVIVVYAIGKSVPFIPNYLYAGVIEIAVIYLLYALKKDSAFYFISDSKLEGVVILNTQSGKVQYYKNYQNVDVLLTSVVTAFNISIKQLVSSSTDIQQIILQDKSILLSKGKFTTTILLVTKKTIISDLITNFLAKRFEKDFKAILEKSPFGEDDMTKFQGFNADVDSIKGYFSY